MTPNASEKLTQFDFFFSQELCKWVRWDELGIFIRDHEKLCPMIHAIIRSVEKLKEHNVDPPYIMKLFKWQYDKFIDEINKAYGYEFKPDTDGIRFYGVDVQCIAGT